MNSYIVLNKTGDESVDVVVDMLNSAGAAHHHTEGWREEWADGMSIHDTIQLKLSNLAKEVKSLKEQAGAS
jgi:hypothetical protein